MKTKHIRLLLLSVGLIAALAISGAVLAQDGEVKDYPEGGAAVNIESFKGPEGNPARPYLEGEGDIGAASLDPAVADALVVRFLVSGITDDGAKGIGTPKEATSITCTNTGSTTASMQVNVYQYDGTLLHTVTINPPALYTFTISTQPTVLYFDDVSLDSDAIYQGSAQILSDSPAIICTAQVLDPLGYPPVFLSAIEILRP